MHICICQSCGFFVASGDINAEVDLVSDLILGMGLEWNFEDGMFIACDSASHTKSYSWATGKEIFDSSRLRTV